MSPVRPASAPPSDILLIEGIRFYGHHGVTPEEQALGGWYGVDVELTLDLTPAALSDDVQATVDYAWVARRVVEVATAQRVRLIERLAALLVDSVLREVPAHEVRVRVRKLTAPMGEAGGIPSVEMRRSR